MEKDEKNAFYVVRKGDIIGIYNSLSDCQAQTGSSVCNPAMSVYKGYCLPKEAQELLVSHGLKNASYVISAADVKDDDIFGKLIPCPFQQPASSGVSKLEKVSPPKRSLKVAELDSLEVFGSRSPFPISGQKHLKSDNHFTNRATTSSCSSCILEFDGASKGNPGPSGAGAVLRTEDGYMVWRIREGVGFATNNVAEYRALIMGLRFALQQGFKSIRAQGDSMLVCNQIEGIWKIKNQNMAELCKVAKELKDKFTSFQITHVLREYNSEADEQANIAINLNDGHVEVDCNKK